MHYDLRPKSNPVSGLTASINSPVSAGGLEQRADAGVRQKELICIHGSLIKLFGNLRKPV